MLIFFILYERPSLGPYATGSFFIISERRRTYANSTKIIKTLKTPPKRHILIYFESLLICTTKILIKKTTHVISNIAWAWKNSSKIMKTLKTPPKQHIFIYFKN